MTTPTASTLPSTYPWIVAIHDRHHGHSVYAGFDDFEDAQDSAEDFGPTAKIQAAWGAEGLADWTPEPTAPFITSTKWGSAHNCTLDYSNGDTVKVSGRRKPAGSAATRYRAIGGHTGHSYPGVSVHDTVAALGGEAYPVETFKVGDGATVCGYSDRRAYTVTAVSPSGKTITMQRDTATLLNASGSGEDDALVVTPGGFAAHTEGTQRYSYTPNPTGHTMQARLGNKSLTWKCSHGRVKAGRFEHYDYNF